jgi:predicted nucleotidyltransferase
MQHPSLFLILSQLRAYVDQCYGDRLKYLILFGSQSRNDATPDSDIDVMLVLARTENAYAEYDRISQFVADLCLEHEVGVADLRYDGLRNWDILELKVVD